MSLLLISSTFTRVSEKNIKLHFLFRKVLASRLLLTKSSPTWVETLHENNKEEINDMSKHYMKSPHTS